MKKNLFALALLLPFIVFSQSKNVNIDARGRDCGGGLGLCSDGISLEPENPIPTIFTKKSDTSFAVIFDNTTTSETLQKRVAGRTFSEMKGLSEPKFVQDHDFIISEKILKDLGINTDYKVIKQGKYSFVFDDKNTSIIFTLSKN